MKTVSGKRFAKVLEDHGWTLEHHIYKSPDGLKTIAVLVHNNADLKVGILSSFLKQAGLTEADL